MTADATGPLYRSSRPIPARGGRKGAGRDLSAEHKLALATGRAESRAVRRYLEAITSAPAGDADPGAMARRIEEIDSQLAAAEPSVKVRLIQERMDLYGRLKSLGGAGQLDELEQEFVAAAAAYSARKGITYAAWRRVGVAPAVLERAGIDHRA